MGVDFELSPLGRIVWEDRYALKDENGKRIEEDISETFQRVSKAIASKEEDPKKWEKKFYDIMSKRLFCPAGRILAHSGTHYPQLFNCFVLPFEDDSLEAIMDTAKNMAVIFKYGGGCGFNYSILRPSGAHIKGVNGHSCGVIGFIHMMSTISEVIEQGGTRRSASLGILEVWHPDIWEFIDYKNNHNWERMLEYMDVKDQEKWKLFKYENLYKWQMYNVSVGISDEFLDALERDDQWALEWEGVEWELYTVVFKKAFNDETYKNTLYEVTADSDNTALWKVKRLIPYPTPKDKFEVVSRRKIKAREIWDRIAHSAWSDGCPGIINLSEARRMHNVEYVSPLQGGNPCAEQMLSGYSSCNLSSLVLSSFVNNGSFDFDLFKQTIHTAVRFADDVIDNCFFPLSKIKEKANKERRVGLGIMALHDMLIKMGIGYDTEEGRNAVEKVMEVLRDEAYKASIKIAKEKGSFPFFDEDKYLESGFIRKLPESIQLNIKENGIRNSTLISIAPTGTIGTLYGVSTGCEPWFSLSYQRNTRLGSYEDGCPEYIKWKRDNHNKEIPDYFKTAQDILPEDHIRMLILLTRFSDSSVSKTINLPNSATVDDVRDAFILAMKNGVKGITVFRDGSKDGVLVNKKIVEGAKKEVEILQDMKCEEKFDSRVSPKKRGNRVEGSTYRVHMQNHNLYITANRSIDDHIVEVFATVGESKNPNAHHTSGVEDSWAEGLGKIISLALRAGVKVESIVRNLKNIPSDKPAFTTIGDACSSELVPSPPHAIARVIEEESKRLNSGDGKIEIINHRCSECGSINTRPLSPTCYECMDCFHSGCGG